MDSFVSVPSVSLKNMVGILSRSTSNSRNVSPSVVNQLPADDDRISLKLSGKCSSSSSSISSDDGFEIINYDDMCIDKLNNDADSKISLAACLIPENQLIQNEFTISENSANYSTKSSAQNASNNVEKTSGSELPTLFEDLAIKNESSCDQINSTDNRKKKYEKLLKEHEKLKIAFVEAGFVATGGCTIKIRCKEIQKVMDDVKKQFSDTSKSSEQYKRLKMIVDGGSWESTCGFFGSGSGQRFAFPSPSLATSFSASSSFSFSTDSPYRRKSKTSIRNRIRPISPIPLKTNNVVTVTTVPVPATCNQMIFGEQSTTNGIRSIGKRTMPFYFSGLSSSNQIVVPFEQKLVTDSVALTLKPPSQPATEPSLYSEQSKIKEEPDQREVSKDETDKVQSTIELLALRNKIKSLEAQLEKTKQEVKKMTQHMNSMREQFMQNVIKLNNLNRDLTGKLAEKDRQITNSNDQIDALELTSLLDDKDREINLLNDHLLSLCALLTANEDEIMQLKNEKRTLKRNSKSEETAEEVLLKRRPDSEDKVESHKEPLTPQHVFDYLCAEFEKSSMKTSRESTSQNDILNQENVQSNNVLGKGNLPLSTESRETNTLTKSLREIEEREQAMATRFSAMSTELEMMKITHDKTKFDLEARLKDGAKQYAKLFIKYDRLKKSSTSNE